MADDVPKRPSFFLPDNLRPPQIGAFWRRYAIMGVLVAAWAVLSLGSPLGFHYDWDGTRGNVSALSMTWSWQGSSANSEVNRAGFEDLVNIVLFSVVGLVCIIFIPAVICAYGWRRFRAGVASASWRQLAAYGLAGAAIFILADYAFEHVGAYSGDPELRHKPSLVLLLVRLSAVGIIGPVAEELAVRFTLYQFLRTKLNFIVAALISSAVFGLMHFGYPDPMKMVICLLAGLLFSWSYERTGSILAPIAIHVLNNCWMQAMRAL